MVTEVSPWVNCGTGQNLKSSVHGLHYLASLLLKQRYGSQCASSRLLWPFWHWLTWDRESVPASSVICRHTSVGTCGSHKNLCPSYSPDCSLCPSREHQDSPFISAVTEKSLSPCLLPRRRRTGRHSSVSSTMVWPVCIVSQVLKRAVGTCLEKNIF